MSRRTVVKFQGMPPTLTQWEEVPFEWIHDVDPALTYTVERHNDSFPSMGYCENYYPTWVSQQMRDGRLRPMIICASCRRMAGNFPRKDLCPVPTFRLAVVLSGAAESNLMGFTAEGPLCEVCDSDEGVELHHWAPKALFGAYEADSWPKSYLCREHHLLWHQTVTEPLTRAKARGFIDKNESDPQPKLKV